MRKVRVFAVCALGGSISFFTQAMVKAAKEIGLDLEIETYSVDEAYTMALESYAVILVAPQVRWHAKRLRERAGDVPVVTVEGRIFALMDGERGVQELVLPYLQDED